MKADDKVIKIVTNGYLVPFDSDPPPAISKNNWSCLRNMKFTVQELKRLESLQCAMEASREDCLIILPLSVVFSNKLRLVVDASRHNNPYVT